MSTKKPKDILYVTRPLCPPWDEGSKNFAYNLAKHVQDSNIHIMTCGQLPGMPKTVTQHPIYSKSPFTFSQKLRSLHYQKYHTHEHDVAHYFFTPTGLTTQIIKSILKNSTTKSIQTIATLRDDTLSDQKLKKTIFGDYVITYTKHSKQKLESLGIKNVIEISPGIDLDNFKPATKDIRTLQQLDIHRSEFIVMFVGEYSRNGGTDYITDTLIQYFQQHPDSPMHFIYSCRVKKEHGDEAKKASTLSKLAEAGLADKVSFSDTVIDMNTLYNLADVILYPVSDLKGKFDIPLVIPEAMACEKPLILSDIPQLSEFTQDDISAKVRYGDIQDLIRTIEMFRENPKQKLALGKKAREYALRRFSIERIAKKYSELYRNI